MWRNYKNASRNILKRFLLPVLYITVLCSCRTQPISTVPVNTETNNIIIRESITPVEWSWDSICTGIQYLYFKNPELPIRWHMVKIELDTPGLELIAYPQKNHISANGSFTGLTVKRFLTKTDTLVAVNASPFDYIGSRFGTRRKISGLYIYEGEQLSPPLKKYAGLIFTRNEDSLEASIFTEQTQVLPENTVYAFGGFYQILKNGVIEKFRYHSFDSRTAAGISADGSVLYLLCVEGERKYSSTGMTFEECASILREAGASDALQLDGGGSSAMIVSHIKTMSYPVLRTSANIFGFTITFH